MAKNKVEIDVVVDDKGTTKKVALGAKQAADNLDKTGKAAGTADRNIKGTAQASANASKNFSKMSQGMGGLVGAYATLAAQLFALSAAYNFLKSAGDLKVLEAGQKAYATTTGVALRVLANDVIAATDAQIRFADASQAVAIGTAAGLTASQLTSLGKAAKDVSLILGRDVTDSFNRLIRGVTKAEPELLDELGVILRLKTATEKYALTLGKSANDLTDFERSQAVAVDVLDQVEKKYSSMLKSFDVSTNTYNKLGKALDDVLNQLKLLVDFVAKPFAEVLSNVPALAIAGFALLLKGPLAAMGVNLNEISIQATKTAQVYRRAADIKIAAAKRVNLSIDDQKKKLQQLSVEAAKGGTQSKLIQQFASGGKMTPVALSTLKRATDAAVKNTADGAKVATGIWKGYTKEIVLAYQKAMLELEIAEKKKVATTSTATAKMKASWAGLAATIRTAGAAILSFGLKLLSIAGWAAIAVTALEAMGVPITQYIKNLFTTKKEASTFEIHAKRIKELNKEYELVNERIKEFIALNPGKAAAEGYGTLGNMIGSVDSAQFTSLVNELPKINNINEAARQYEDAVKANRQAAITRDEQNRSNNMSFLGGLEQLGKNQSIDVKTNEDSKQEILKSLGVDTITLTDAQKQAQKFVDDQISVYKQLDAQVPSPIFEKYITLLETAKNSTKEFGEESVQEFLRTKAEVEAYGKVIINLPRTINEATAAFTGFIQSIAPLNKEEQTIQSLSKSIKDLELISQQSDGLTPENSAILEQQKKELAFVENIYNRRLKGEIDLKSLQTENNKRMRDATDLMKAQVASENSQRENRQKILNLDSEELTIREAIEQNGGKITQSQVRRISLLRLEKLNLEEANALLDERIKLEKATVDERAKLQQLALDVRVIQVQQNMLSMLDKERALRKDIFNLAEAEEKAKIDREVDMLGPFEDKKRIAAEKMYDLELKLLPIKEQQIKDEYALKIKQIDLEYDLLEAQKQIQANELRILAEKLKGDKDPAQQDRAKGVEDLANRVAGQDYSEARELAKELANSAKDTALQGLLEGLRKLRDAKDDLSDMGKLTNALEDGLENGLGSAISGLIQGTYTLKEAFANFALSTLKMLSDLIAQMIAVRLLGAAMGMLSFGSAPPASAYGTPGASAVPPPPTGEMYAKYGAVFSNGSKMPGYATGGIAKGALSGYPAMLHGTEAVVPLPNGKSIPVDMKGAGQNNNVVVNVSVDSQGRGQTTTESQSGANAGNLGQAIAKAVQQELQNQKRSGGILNPYGVA
jgi:hypothetical protein